MQSFYKTEDCPASEILAALRGPKIESDELRLHLADCEFCAAELEFYRRFPPREERVEPANIPEPLFQLADELLHKKKDFSELYKLAGKRD